LNEIPRICYQRELDDYINKLKTKEFLFG
jgi:hypothetical protein